MASAIVMRPRVSSGRRMSTMRPLLSAPARPSARALLPLDGLRAARRRARAGRAREWPAGDGEPPEPVAGDPRRRSLAPARGRRRDCGEDARRRQAGRGEGGWFGAAYAILLSASRGPMLPWGLPTAAAYGRP